MRLRRTTATVTGIAISASLVAVSPLAASPSSTFNETFDGQPSAITAFSDPAWDVAIHTRDRASWYQANPGNTAQHGADCSPPPARHAVGPIAETVFQCKDHLMTAMNDDGFGVVTLTPNHMLDLSADEAQVSFDLSTVSSNGYDWVELMLTPFEDNLVHPASDFWQVAGPPDNSIQLSMTPGDETRFVLTVHRHGVPTTYQFCGVPCKGIGFANIGSESFSLVPSSTRRETFEFTLTDNRYLSFGVVNYFDGTDNDQSYFWQDTIDIGDLGWDSAVVQLQHFSFNPTNNCDGDPACDGDTWHWDNVRIDPSIPFAMIASEHRAFDPGDDGEALVSFNAAAAADSFVRFSAIGNDMEVSFDDGASWESAQLQRTAEDTSSLSGRFRNYWTPGPEGTDRIVLRGAAWWGGDWHARDFSIWSR